MKISELMHQLEKVLAEYGDLDVRHMESIGIEEDVTEVNVHKSWITEEITHISID